MDPLRVLLVTSALGPPTRGNGVTVARWRGWAGEAGLEVHAMHPDGDAPRESFDLVHGYHAVHGGERARDLAHAREVPLVVSLGGSDLYALTGGAIVDPTWKARTTDVLRAAAVTTGAFPAFGRVVHEALGDEVAYAWVPRGVALPRGGTMSARAPGSSLRVLMPAGLRPIKDPLLALRLLQMLRDAGVDVQLDLLGPPLHDATARAVTNAAAAMEGVTLGLVPLVDMPARYEAADVVWNTSLHEGGSNALLEAAAYGCAVFARDVPGNHELLAASKLGTLFDPQQAGWEEAAIRFHRDAQAATEENPPQHLMARRDHARAWLRTHHGERAEILALRAAYERALRPSPA